MNIGDEIMKIDSRVIDIVVTYNNKGNDVIISEWKPEVTNLFFGLISYARRNETRTLKLDYDYILALAGINKEGDYRFMKKMFNDFFNDGLNNFAIAKYNESKVEEEFSRQPIFNDVRIIKTDRTVLFEFSDTEIANFFLDNDSKEFTKFNLSEFMQLENKFSKTLFRILSQFQNTGYVIMDFNNLKSLFGKDNLATNRFNREVVKLSVDEINEKNVMIENLSYKLIKKGTVITGIKFVFDECKYNDNKALERKNDLYKSQLLMWVSDLSELIDQSPTEIIDNLLPLEKNVGIKKLSKLNSKDEGKIIFYYINSLYYYSKTKEAFKITDDFDVSKIFK